MIRAPRFLRLPFHLGTSLQRRLSILSALAVGLGVLVTGVAAYLFTSWALYDQLDRELTSVAAYEAGVVKSDYQTMGGLNSDALTAASATLFVYQASGVVTQPVGQTVSLPLGPPELAIARTQVGQSARTVRGSDGRDYRVVAVPLAQASGDQQAASLVIARPLGPTQRVLSQLSWVLLLFGVLMAVAAGVVGAFVARQGLAPVRRLTGAVRQITETDQLNPIEVEGDDEVASLSRSFNTMLSSLESSRERQRRLIADASHELRTPLTSMRTNIELLVADDKTGMLPEGARSDILHDVASQLSEFSSLVGDLVHLSRDEQVQPSPEPVDVRDIVTAAVTRAQRRGPGLTFDVTLSPLFLVGEPDQLERAITNLLDNAVKFSPPDGTVHLQMDGQTITVGDEGPGIADEDLPKVFDRFFRSDQARNTPGTGLGLSIVTHTIKSHGGTVTAGRSPFGGAEFVVTLPGTTEDPDAPAAPVDEEEPA